MNVTIRFYSISKDLAGASEMSLIVKPNALLADALELLYTEKPSLVPIRSSVLYAVGLQYATMDTRLAEGNTISLIPPVQGG